MLNLFRHNTVSAALLVVLLAVLFRLQFLIHPVPYAFTGDAFLSKLFFNFLGTFPASVLISYVIALLLTIVQAVMLNYTISRHNVLYKDTYLPGFFFVLLGSLYPEQFQLTPQLLSATFLILVFQRLCYLYESPKPLLLVLDSGIYLGIGIMFNYELILFLPFILISVVVFTSFNLRYIIISLMGIILPMYFVLVFYYMYDRLPELIETSINGFYQIRLQPITQTYEQLAPWIFILPLAGLGALNLQQNFFRNKVKVRRILQSVAVLGFFCALSLFTEKNGMVTAVSFLSFPLSIAAGYYLISTKRFWLKESLVFGIILIAAWLQIK